MGEVYRARDTKLARDVAIKVLPAHLADDPERLARMQREARLLAALNHPNIAAIYGLEDADGVTFLAMELAEGQTLAQKLTGGALGIDEAFEIALQIAEALGAAHERGIVHRDLKPANIQVATEGSAAGQVKVLDFGLAKAYEADGESAEMSADLSASPTMAAATRTGVIMGTAAYMSPEQARGKPLDKRADIWAFGVILHEMLTGQRLFDGETASDILAAVLRGEVDFSHVPAPARSVVQACLQRDAKERLRDVGDVPFLLGLDRPDDVDAPATQAPSSSRAGWLWPALATISASAALVLAVLFFGQTTPVPPEMIIFPIAGSGQAPAVTAISPDGRHVLYIMVPDGSPPELWARSLASLEGRPVPNSEGIDFRVSTLVTRALAPVAAWSRDSQEVVFAVAGSLRRVDILTGQVTVLAELTGSSAGPGAWGVDGTILYGRPRLHMAGSGIWGLPETGGIAVQVTRLGGSETVHLPSSFLPGGRRFLYFASGIGDERSGEVRIGSLDRLPDEQDMTVLLTADGPALYAPATDGHSGHILFSSRGSLMVQPFEHETATLEGEPKQVASGVGSSFSVSADGRRLAYRLAGEASGPLSELIRFDRSGRELETIGPPADYGGVGRFADGRSLVVSRVDAGQLAHTHIVDIARAAFTRLGSGPAYDAGEVVSPDDLVAYTFSPEGLALDIYVRASNGVGEARLLISSDNMKHPNDFSPDGRFLIYDEHDAERDQDLLLVGVDGGDPVPFLTTEADETHGQFSADGQWIAYESTESGRNEVYVRDFAPDQTPAHGSERAQISLDGGSKPRWGPSGREIFFLRPDGMLVAAPLSLGTTLEVGTPEELFPTRWSGFFSYVVMPDGTFIAQRPIELPPEATPPLVVMLNWQSVLQR